MTAARSTSRPWAERLRTPVLLLLGFAASVVFASPALAGPRFFFGVNDDTMKWSTSPEKVAAVGTDLGVRAFRITLPWTRGERSLAGSTSSRSTG